ncbi:hypothetical protein C0V75_22245 [Tabrizicola sp. TH137]|nr:hypothetical protein C0V75_22245 [Tabrizicola sp. TH137]
MRLDLSGKVESTNRGTRRCSIGAGNSPTLELWREAVRLALTSVRTRRKIAEDLSIGLSTPTLWLRDERDVCERSEVPVDVHIELRWLRRENAVLKLGKAWCATGSSTMANALFAKEG